jgi:hypothetical protein
MRFTAKSSAFIRAPQRVIYSALTGYRLYETWVPDITRSRLLAREGELAIMQLIAPPYGREKLDLEIVQSPYDSLVFTQVDRFRQDGIFGRFELAPAGDGSGTMVVAALGTHAGLHRFRCRKTMRRILEHTLEALADRALKLMTSGLAETPDQRAKLLEIEIAGKEVTLRVGGDTYELVRKRREGTPA